MRSVDKLPMIVTVLLVMLMNWISVFVILMEMLFDMQRPVFGPAEQEMEVGGEDGFGNGKGGEMDAVSVLVTVSFPLFLLSHLPPPSHPVPSLPHPENGTDTGPDNPVEWAYKLIRVCTFSKVGSEPVKVLLDRSRYCNDINPSKLEGMLPLKPLSFSVQ
eukprot:TRINITY_DN6541_c0_g2_i1.p1 TRINITY_DN6541_c0_g2~~TRINITY_DN6541_c0_g2_i1.p1  ORF type:complete len:160 (-),score=37.51 TRINITY_DN6541_c0_g2_i1:252-731(-)